MSLETCIDWKGDRIGEGGSYVPPDQDDPCFTCSCESGFATACRTVHCSPPVCSLWEKVEGKCCAYNCIQLPSHVTPPINETSIILDPGIHPADAANLSLRLVASTVTTFLILALLMFMIHRLRQRRILIMMRRMQNAEDDDTVAYVSDFNSLDMGSTFPPYEDPPPPYTPPKPLDLDEIEAPPPYRETAEEDNNNDTVTNGQIPSGCPPYSESQINRSNTATQTSNVNENMPNNSNSISNPQDEAETNLPQVLNSMVNDNNALNIGQSAALNTAANNVQLCGTSPTNNEALSSNNLPQEFFATLDKNGQVKATCAASVDNLGRNKTRNVETPIKKRSKCSHVKRNKAATRSCSFKDGYAQTLPVKSSKKENSNDMMRNSYHASTSTSEFQNEIPEFNWASIEVNHIKQAQVAKLKTQGNNSKEVASNDLNSIPNSINNDSSIEYSNKEEVALLKRQSSLNDDVLENVKLNHSSDVSQISVCSETGEERISGSNQDTSRPIVSDHKDVLNLSNNSCGFDNLRDALKSDLAHTSARSPVNSRTPLIINHNNSEPNRNMGEVNNTNLSNCQTDSKFNNAPVNCLSSSPSGTKPKIKRLIYCDPDDICFDKDENKSSNQHERQTAAARSPTSNLAAYPDNCKKQSKGGSPTSEEKKNLKSKDKSRISPKNALRKVSGIQNKRRSELFPGQSTSKNDGDVMTRSVCTAAEYGFDVKNVDETIKDGKFLDSPTGKLKKEKIKRKESPEAFRRISMAYDDNNQFKQYGFIDMPNSIENVDNMLREERVRSEALKNKSRSHSREKRSTSHERKRSGSGSRNNSAERMKKRHSSYLAATNNSNNKDKYNNLMQDSPSPKLRSRSRENSAGRRKRKSTNPGACYLAEIDDCNIQSKISNAEELNHVKSGDTDKKLFSPTANQTNGVRLIKYDQNYTRDFV